MGGMQSGMGQSGGGSQYGGSQYGGGGQYDPWQAMQGPPQSQMYGGWTPPTQNWWGGAPGTMEGSGQSNQGMGQWWPPQSWSGYMGQPGSWSGTDPNGPPGNQASMWQGAGGFGLAPVANALSSMGDRSLQQKPGGGPGSNPVQQKPGGGGNQTIGTGSALGSTGTFNRTPSSPMQNPEQPSTSAYDRYQARELRGIE